jgi:hypothetical protein
MRPAGVSPRSEAGKMIRSSFTTQRPASASHRCTSFAMEANLSVHFSLDCAGVSPEYTWVGFRHPNFPT